MKPHRIFDLLQEAGHRLVLGDRRVRLLALLLLLGAVTLLVWSLARVWSDRPVTTARVDAACETATGRAAAPPSPAATPAEAARQPAVPAGAQPQSHPQPTC